MTRRIRFVAAFSVAALLLCKPAGADDSALLNQKGLNELRRNNPESAIEFFIKAISIDTAQKHYYNNLGASYMRIGEYLKAEEQLKISLSIDNNYAKALSNMAVTLFHLGHYRESYTYYSLSKKADSGYTKMRFDKKRVSSLIKKTFDEKPGDEELKKIKNFMGTD